MSANSLHINLPPDEQPSLAPWLVILACSAILLLLVSQLATRIPEKIEQQAQAMINPAVFPDLTVHADGRDLKISGTVNIDNPIGPLVDELGQINGVRHISDDVLITDPALQERQQMRQFELSLASIDTGGVDFEPGSVSFTPNSDTALSQLLALLRQYPNGRIRIEGHTDNTGADTVNVRVSRERAKAVANYLVARGVSADQLIAIGYGSTQPIADNTTEGGRARNRRIEINLVR